MEQYNPNEANFISFFFALDLAKHCAIFCFIKNVNRNADNKSHQESGQTIYFSLQSDTVSPLKMIICQLSPFSLSLASLWTPYNNFIHTLFFIFYSVVYLLLFFFHSFLSYLRAFFTIKKKITFSVSLHSYEVTTSQLRFKLNNDD